MKNHTNNITQTKGMQIMKTSILFLISFFILTTTNSFSTPLNGTYTIGSGGDYPTISSAIGDVQTQGISGPVIFNIISGIYNETVSVSPIPGSNLFNTFTLKSQSGNSSDVEVSNVYITASNISIMNITINSSEGIGIYNGDDQHNVNIINNDFRNHRLWVFTYWGSNSTNINILGNLNVSEMNFSGEYWFVASQVDSVQIKNNIINGNLWFKLCKNFLIENNIISGGMTGGSESFKIMNNKITGLVDISGIVYNNFILGQVRYYAGYLINNTIVGGTFTIPSLPFLRGCRNNIIINPAGGPTANHDSTSSGSDYNVFYNGGNSNLINFEGIAYNNVLDFYNASGSDQHSSDQPVNFVSPTDLHLAPTSFGDPLLRGIPDTNVVDDIDGQTRSLTSPFKGADEIFDTPTPVELSVFTSSIIVNNVNLNWTTTSETNNMGFAIERSVDNNLVWRNIGFVEGHGSVTTSNNYEFVDKNLNTGKYNYRLKQIEYNGNFEYYNLSGDVLIGSPEKFSLSQNYPNPFNPTTRIAYDIASNSNVQLKVYDVSGKEVMSLVNGFKEAGRYETTFNGSNFASGVYYYKLTAGNFTDVKKMFFIK